MNLRIALLLLLPWMMTAAAWGQVKAFVLMDQEQFLPGEAVPIKVRVVNHSGQTLRFGEGSRWLKLTIQTKDAFVISQTGEVPVTGVFDLPPSKMATKELDIAPYFALNRPGRYSVVASVFIEEWNQNLTSEPTSFDVINGTKLWERAFGVPNSVLPDGSPEVRKYLLQQANHLRTQIRLYARITDASEEQTLAVVPIGPMVSFSDPKAQLDKNSNLHVLYQSGPRIATYFAIDPNGKVLEQEKFEYTSTRPRLVAAEDGTVSVLGGMQLPKAPTAQESANPGNEEG